MGRVAVVSYHTLSSSGRLRSLARDRGTPGMVWRSQRDRRHPPPCGRVDSSVLSLKFLVKIAKGQKQILRLTTPKLKSVWGPIPTPATKTCRRGPRFAQDDRSVYGMDFRLRTRTFPPCA